jgi:hypothetical protein
MFMVSGILRITDIHIEIRSKIELGIMANHKEFKKFRVEYLLKCLLAISDFKKMKVSYSN